MYSTCGKKYEYHYIHRLRESIQSAALLFGSAIDVSLNEMLLDKKNNKLNTVKHYQDVFQKNWIFGTINNVVVPLKQSIQIAYAESDFDGDLLNDEDIEELGFNSKSAFLRYYQYVNIQKKKVGLSQLIQKDQKILNEANWRCLFHKGNLMLEAYYKEILPQIKQVLEVQKQVNLINEEDDNVIGFIDAVLDFGAGPVILDNKTSSRQYEMNSASVSPQLAVYKHTLQEAYPNAKTAFAVMYKRMLKEEIKTCSNCGHNGSGERFKTCNNEQNNKRCNGEWQFYITHKARVEIIHGDISKELEDNVVDNYEVILKGIKNNIFYRNWSSCEQAYGNCAYLMLCRKNKDDKLIKV